MQFFPQNSFANRSTFVQVFKANDYVLVFRGICTVYFDSFLARDSLLLRTKPRKFVFLHRVFISTLFSSNSYSFHRRPCIVNATAAVTASRPPLMESTGTLMATGTQTIANSIASLGTI